PTLKPVDNYLLIHVANVHIATCNTGFLNDDVLQEKIGKIPEYKGTLKLKSPEVKPIYIKHRQIPYALISKVEDEIARLESLGIIEPVTHATWGTPVVPIVKPDGKIRLCADYKTTINKFIHEDKYPIPKIEDIFNKLSGGKYFCKLDIYQAYLHMEMDEDSKMLQAISTHKGTYKVNRLMFVVKVAANMWQLYMDEMLQDLDGVVCFFDDIAVQGKTPEELFTRVEKVLQKLRENGLHANKKKCTFFQNSIT